MCASVGARLLLLLLPPPTLPTPLTLHITTSYVDARRRPVRGDVGEWGDDPEIRALEELVDRPVEIWDVEKGAEGPMQVRMSILFSVYSIQ